MFILNKSHGMLLYNSFHIIQEKDRMKFDVQNISKVNVKHLTYETLVRV